MKYLSFPRKFRHTNVVNLRFTNLIRHYILLNTKLSLTNIIVKKDNKTARNNFSGNKKTDIHRRRIVFYGRQLFLHSNLTEKRDIFQSCIKSTSFTKNR